MPAVMPVGIAASPERGSAILVTEYLPNSLQYRRLLSRVPPGPSPMRERLLDAMAGLLVELHRAGIYWGDCSLANTLFRRDGDKIQAYLVDAETSEVHPSLSDGQRAYDLEVLGENVAYGLVIRKVPRAEREARVTDALRMVRAVRLAAILELRIEPATLAAIRERAPLASHLSGERLAMELEKLLSAPRPSIGLRLLEETGLLAIVSPDLAAQRGVPQNKVEGEDLWEPTLRTVDAAPAGRPIVRLAALLHDIGKMGVPDHILLKPDQLTEEEWIIMRKHTTFAYEMLSPIAFLRQALDIPYCHHEKWDGTGYPRGLKGSQIPPAARMFAVVDVWDALTSDRPYRPGWPKNKTKEYIREQSGKHFDPQVVAPFLELIKD